MLQLGTATLFFNVLFQYMSESLSVLLKYILLHRLRACLSLLRKALIKPLCADILKFGLCTVANALSTVKNDITPR